MGARGQWKMSGAWCVGDEGASLADSAEGRGHRGTRGPASRVECESSRRHRARKKGGVVFPHRFHTVPHFLNSV